MFLPNRALQKVVKSFERENWIPPKILLVGACERASKCQS